MQTFKSDIEIAQSTQMQHISAIANKINIDTEQLEMYGKYKAKLPLHLINEEKVQANNLILVTAISPTPAGEGKTTTSIGLADALNVIGKQAVVAIREPSLGPVFGIKGGAAGGGYSQVVPMEDINLHFTGDFSAIEKANNLLAAMIDNNIQSKSGNLDIDPRTVNWKRVMDMNDRALRSIISGLGGKNGGIMREAGFNITAASEIMAILCLSNNIQELKERIANIYVGSTYDGNAIYARDLKAEGAMTALLKDAIMPNIVQTLEGTPAFVHGGPFANIAQGTNSIIATKMALSHSEYVVTEAGFGADLGAEKFFDIKCRAGNISPKAVVIVATIKALKYHGGCPLANIKEPSLEYLKKGIVNLEKHIENVNLFGLPAVVSINKFYTDTDEELNFVKARCTELGVKAAISEGWEKGGKGCTELAKDVCEAIENSKDKFKPLYKLDLSIQEKINTIATKIYGAANVEYAPKAMQSIKNIEALGLAHLPICMAKTPNSFSDDPKLLGRPSGFTIHVREFEIAAGAGFIVPITGEIMRMPGLPAVPAACGIDIDENGVISGLS